jgi:uncharacterized protein (TIGR02001 family)
MKFVNRGIRAGAGTVVLLLSTAGSAVAETTANATMSNNYLWRGLTQTENDPSIAGGIDYVAASGFYVGTWVSNVSYFDTDPFSYEHDIYFGYSGGGDLGYDIGYLYYNYDSLAKFDFGEIYGSLSYGGLTATAYLLANTEAEEGVKPFGPGEIQDFGFGEAYYVALDYSVPLRDDLSLNLHIGQHSGDFAEAFNGVTTDYIDYSIALSKGNFTFAISDTDLDALAFDDSGSYVLDPDLTNEWSGNDNGSVKIVASYAMDFAF